MRLRITCDKKYPILYQHILKSLQKFLPDNKINLINRNTCVDVYCYSNKLEDLLGWRAKAGSKYIQKVKIPSWVLRNKQLTKECLRGLVQTDGSIYSDRGYLMVNIVSTIPSLAESIIIAIKNIGHKPNIQTIVELIKIKHTIRISKNAQKFIDDIAVWKK